MRWMRCDASSDTIVHVLPEYVLSHARPVAVLRAWSGGYNTYDTLEHSTFYIL
jgi:hypothetical protein